MFRPDLKYEKCPRTFGKYCALPLYRPHFIFTNSNVLLTVIYRVLATILGVCSNSPINTPCLLMSQRNGSINKSVIE